MLGGGALKGLTHLGVWRALDALGIRVAGIVGTSIGAVVGAALASGRSVEDVEADARVLRPKDVVAMNRRILLPFGVRQKGVFKGGATLDFMRAFVGEVTWDDLGIPLSVNAVDLGSGRTVWFGHEGDTSVPLAEAVYASSALPVLYPPLEYGGRVFVDGGVLDKLPIGRAKELGATSILAVDAGAGLEEDPAEILANGLIGLNQRVFGIMSEQRTRTVVSEDHGVPVKVVRPRLDGEGSFDFERVEYFLEEGYRATMEALGGE